MLRWINAEKCTGCGTCFKSCGLDVFRLDTAQAEISPCTAGCPAGTDIRGYHYLLQQGLFHEALARLKQTMPFPAVVGRVCPHTCETDCARKDVDKTININAIEEFLGELDLAAKTEAIPRRHIFKVAVVGSGPAGMSSAWYLTLAGYPVTVFEARNEAGGMLRYGIPDYRLPETVLTTYIKRLENMGVKFRYNTRIGDNGDLSLKELEEYGYRAVVLALGAGVSRPLPLDDGATLPAANCASGLDFLAAARQNALPALKGKRVLVIGGGDVAVDAAVTASRMGAQASMVCLESCETMPAFAHNIEDARRHGVTVENGWGPKSIKKEKDSFKGISFKSCTQVFDQEGCFAPSFDLDKEMFMEADFVVYAIGQAVDAAGLARDILLQPSGRIQADEITGQTSRLNVFAAGDAVSGPASVVKAITAGREAAVSVERLLTGLEVPLGRGEKRPVVTKFSKDLIEPYPRRERQLLPTDKKTLFLPFDLEAALAESTRCMTCGSKAWIAYPDDCMTCFSCEVKCPGEAIDVHPFKEVLPRTLDLISGGVK